MKCPRDGEELTIKRIHEVDVHDCVRCGGMFLDRGELNKVAEPTAGDLEFSTLDLDDFRHEDASPPISCPRDGVEMKKVDFNIYTNIILDYCSACSAFWVDAAELEHINAEVRELNAAAKEVPDPTMLWFAKFIWSLPFSQ